MSTVTVSTKGWVVIPAELRRKYRLTSGSQVLVVDYGGVLALVPSLKDPLRQTRGMLKGSTSLTQTLLAEPRQEALHE